MRKPLSPPQELIQALLGGQNFLIFGHIHPDSDCLSSQIAMALGLESLGKSVQLITNTETGAHSFIEQYPFGKVVPQGWTKDNTQAIVVDCHSADRISMVELLGDFVEISSESGKTHPTGTFVPFGFPTLVIDHHQEALEPLAATSWIESLCPATAYLVYKLLDALQVTMTPEISKLLFQGIAADTGFFRFLRPQMGDVFTVAGTCVDQGANPYEIHQNIYGGKDIKTPQFIAAVLGRMEVLAGGKVVITYETESDLQNYGAENRDPTEVYDLLLAVESCEAVVYLKRTAEGNTIAGLRSKSYMNMSHIAQKFGGGGHMRAAGFRVATPPLQVLEQLKPVLLEHLQATP